MTLTEKWKKGELESGWYYVKGADGLIGMMSDYALYRVNLEHPDNEITLLAKMPSYEEWKNVTTCFDYEHKAYLSMVEENQQLHKWCEEFNALDVAKENQRLQMSLRMTVDDYKNVVDICEQLKELLKECHPYVRQTTTYTIEQEGKRQQLDEKIDNAIGDK